MFSTDTQTLKMKGKRIYLWIKKIFRNTYYNGCSLKFLLNVDVEQSIVNTPRIMDHGSAV
jgi:hypothetical protein